MSPAVTTSLGVALGLGAAAGQSLAYLFLRRFTTAVGGRRELLVMSFVIQGAVCLPLVPLLWPANLPPITQWAGPILAKACFFIFAQACLFTALRHTEASRVSPMMAVKIVIVALLTTTLLNDVILPMQWAAVALAVAGAFVLNYTGGAVPWRAGLAVLGACIGYSSSDFSIRLMLDAMEPVPRLRAAAFGLTVVYVLLGVMMLPLLRAFGSRRADAWRAAAPYALMWLGAMGFLYGSFATAGIVLGGIAQSMRGIISVGLGALLAAQGLVHLEQRVTRSVLWRRVAAAVLMSAAVALYAVSGASGEQHDATATGRRLVVKTSKVHGLTPSRERDEAVPPERQPLFVRRKPLE